MTTPNSNLSFDYLIIGAGVIGLAVARALTRSKPGAKIAIIEKEHDVAEHQSGRNSGVLHAGFYYTADSLKAKFTVAGNSAMRTFCRENALEVNECGKLVVATNDEEVKKLYELAERGNRNGSMVEIISLERARAIEPRVKSVDVALWSPLTASVDPLLVCKALRTELERTGAIFHFNCGYRSRSGNSVVTSTGQKIEAQKIFNCAGLYADKIAKDFGFGEKYTIIPFKGLYLKYSASKDDVRVNIYPVPNLKNPFLGVHFTKTVHGDVKIGPTAIPALWRENYNFKSNFKLDEFLQIAFYESKLFLKNAFNFRSLAFEEMRKYSKGYFIGLSQALVDGIDPRGFGDYVRPGIRAQLLNKETLELVQDFIVEGDERSVHVLNAVSPAFTCSLPFGEWIAERFA